DMRAYAFAAAGIAVNADVEKPRLSLGSLQAHADAQYAGVAFEAGRRRGHAICGGTGFAIELVLPCYASVARHAFAEGVIEAEVKAGTARIHRIELVRVADNADFITTFVQPGIATGH